MELSFTNMSVHKVARVHAMRLQVEDLRIEHQTILDVLVKQKSQVVPDPLVSGL
jgi:hypothetical protein